MPGRSGLWSRRALPGSRRSVQAVTVRGAVFFAAALLGLIIANSAWQEAYWALRALPVVVHAGSWSLDEPLVGWVNELLMGLFFLLIGLGIKHELIDGELHGLRRASLAIFAALGGMIVPAIIFASVTWGSEGARGWGVPMATDIAFALAALSLLGPSVPLGLKIFLTALAVVDDLGAVLVIALFYTDTVDLRALMWAGILLLLALTAGRAGIRNLIVYAALGLVLWYFVLASGVDAAIAGVLVALAVPVTRRLEPAELRARLNGAVQLAPEELTASLGTLQRSLRDGQSPASRLESWLAPWVAYGALPLFAFFNTGVAVVGTEAGTVAVGTFLGLLVGKPVGILLAAWLAVRWGLAVLPNGASWRALVAVSVLGGIGFTLSLFIAELAFGGTPLLAQAKLGALAASLLSVLVGLTLLARATRSAR